MSRSLVGRAIQHDLEAIKSRLREIRQHSMAEAASLASEFKENVAAYQHAHFLSARDAEEAIACVRGIAATDTIVINRSSVVANELRPGLERHGFRVNLVYSAELSSFENKVRDYWDLPNLLSKGLTGAFEVSRTPEDVRLAGRDGGSVKDCVAVLGVNAASARDGSVFFLQHLSNISESLEQARQVVLVVGIDKLVKDREDAAFQTKCMGIFGMESMLLGLQPGRTETGEPDTPTVSQEPQEREVHVVLLDNGRSRISQSDFKELLLCIGCKACARQCPIHRFEGRAGAVWSPRDYLFMSLLDGKRSTAACLHCEACRVECPLSIDLPKLMWMAQADYAARHGRSFRDRVLGNPELLARVGTLAAPFSTVVANVDPGKTMIRMALGLDRKRALPRFHRRTFKKRFANRHSRDMNGESGRRVAYYVGCFSNYYEPEVAGALVDVMHRSRIRVVVPNQKCCGMPMMATQNVAGARRNAGFNIQSLAALAAEGYDIVAACPSCSLMIKREYPNMYDSYEARLVSEHVYYIDEYLALLNREGSLDTGLGELSESVFYHAPCHTKVEHSVAESLDLLRLIPGLSIDAVSSVCCGMAGYHGFKKPYSAQSMEIGGKLFEEIRLSRSSRVVTSCAACRLQIEAGASTQAVHPIKLFQEAYAIGSSTPGRAESPDRRQAVSKTAVFSPAMK